MDVAQVHELVNRVAAGELGIAKVSGEGSTADFQTQALDPACFNKLLNQLPLIVPTMGRLNGTVVSCMPFCNIGTDGIQAVCR